MSTSLFSSKSLFRLKVCWIFFSSFFLLTIETISLGLDLVFGTAYLSDFLAYKCHWLMLVSLKKGSPFFLFQEGTIVWAHSAIHLCPPKFLVTKELVCSKILQREVPYFYILSVFKYLHNLQIRVLSAITWHDIQKVSINLTEFSFTHFVQLMIWQNNSCKFV